MIKGLLKKDFYNLSSYKTSLIIIILFCGISIIGTETVTIVPTVICTIIGMMALSTFSYDEMSKANKYILTLPTNRKELVKEKYILAVGATIFGGIIGFVLTIIVVNIMNMIRPENIINLDYESLITTTIGGMCGIAVIQAIQIPSIYKWGAEKGRIQMFELIFIIIVIILGIGFLIMKAGININFDIIKKFISRFGLLLIGILMIIMYFISYKTSCKIYKNKEE